MDGFVDARLHISVRPHLEYHVPTAGMAVREALLGDVRAKQRALKALDQCLRPEHETRNAAATRNTHDKDVEGEDEDTQQTTTPLPFRSLCARVCTHAHEYVAQVEHAWSEYLTRLAAGVSRETEALHHATREAKRVYLKYRARNPDTVERAYRAEVQSLATRLDAFTDECRTSPVPTCERPTCLVTASHELKEAFASAYGTQDTRALLRAKARFEKQLHDLQRPLAQAFVTRMTALLA